MNLIEILVKNKVQWPANAEYAYQSVVDTEVYFFNNRHDMIHRTRNRRTQFLEPADKRGPKHTVNKLAYDQYIAAKFFEPVLKAGGPTAYKNQERDKMIKRIENGLRKDFNIDSPELAEEMFNKGWRK